MCAMPPCTLLSHERVARAGSEPRIQWPAVALAGGCAAILCPVLRPGRLGGSPICAKPPDFWFLALLFNRAESDI